MNKKCTELCPVVRECNTRVNVAADKQEKLLRTYRKLTEDALCKVHVGFPNGAVEKITFVAQSPALRRVQSSLNIHTAFIGEVATGAAAVGFAQENCKEGPQLQLRGELLLSMATIAHAGGVMQAENYLVEREEVTKLYPRCSNPDALAAIAQVPILGHRYAR